MALAKTVSIQDLFNGNYKFVIRPYQRGYRWEKKQIEYLIKDLSSVSRGTEYCLQPIIVMPTNRENEYELVDGQQRLTTLWILKEIYSAITEKFEDSTANKNYSIEYENKYPLQAAINRFHDYFSERPKEKLSKIINGDDSYIYGELASNLTSDAYGNQMNFVRGIHPDIDAFIDNVQCIVNYSAPEKAETGFEMQPFSVFLNNIFRMIDGIRRSSVIKVIWYELDPNNKNEDPITVFTNVNANKIKLTNSELIKARLMYEVTNSKSIPDVDKRRYLTRDKLALEWESIERQLNNDSFWAFIHGKKGKYATNIDFIFEIWIQSRDGKNLGTAEEFWIYDYIDDSLNNSLQGVEDIWKEIRNIFYTLTDWYHDNTNNIYHLLGLLVAVSKTDVSKIISDYYKEQLKQSKNEFVSALKSKIRQKIYVDGLGQFDKENFEKWLRTLDYDQNKDTIQNVLLCYNIASLINAKNNYERFPFDLFNEDDYDIEHINPKSHYRNETDENKKAKNTKQIGNLVLLDAHTNRSDEYKTQSYGEKRNIIIRVLRHGKASSEDNDLIKYIPIGTRWVFLEAFEDISDSSILNEWTKHDDYISDIAKNIVEMLGAGDVNEEVEENEE